MTKTAHHSAGPALTRPRVATIGHRFPDSALEAAVLERAGIDVDWLGPMPKAEGFRGGGGRRGPARHGLLPRRRRAGGAHALPADHPLWRRRRQRRRRSRGATQHHGLQRPGLWCRRGRDARDRAAARVRATARCLACRRPRGWVGFCGPDRAPTPAQPNHARRRRRRSHWACRHRTCARHLGTGRGQ